MNLRELQTAVENAIKMVYEREEKPRDIPVTIQIDDEADPHHGYIQTDRDLELHYDGNCMTSGCVIQGCRDSREVEAVLQGAGYKTVIGADAVCKAISDCAHSPLTPTEGGGQ